MKTVIIISPYFPPSNAADMQRVRMSLPYFTDFGWNAEVVTVDISYSEAVLDPILNESVPTDASIHYVKALSKKITSKLGLGSLALRSLLFYRKKVDAILKEKKVDLIYFSTTQFPICILGTWWKKKYKVPFIIDMQDPWHSDFYKNKPKHERPPKYWFSYWLNKKLEPIAMNKVDGLISVSKAYLTTLSERYRNVRTIPQEVITFGAFEKDFILAAKQKVPTSYLKEGKINIVYVGRGGHDMQSSLRKVLTAFSSGLKSDYSYFSRFHFNFLGTSYAPAGMGKPSTESLVNELKINEFVSEVTDRIPFYDALNLLQAAHILFIPGSEDPQYTASKIYPYIISSKPLLSIFDEKSSAHSILKACRIGTNLTLQMSDEKVTTEVLFFLKNYEMAKTDYDRDYFSQFTARKMTEKQCIFFEKVLG